MNRSLIYERICFTVNDNYSITLKSEKISDTIKWKNINWEKANKCINRLQIRIIKAIKEEKWNTAKRLQYLLTNSFYAKALAVKKVTSNKGKNTAGIDNKIWSYDKEKINAIQDLKTHKYKSQPTKRIYIPKKNGMMRPLSIPTMKDRAMQTLQVLALQPIAETMGDLNSYGFRKYRSCHDAMSRIFLSLSHRYDPEWILEGDIKGCFDNISHKWLLENIPMDKRILKEFIKTGFVYKKKIFPNSKGAAQGGAISPILANMTLDGLEAEIFKKVNIGKKGFQRKNNKLYKIRYIRYADDFIVAAKTPEILIKIKEVIKEFMKERGLELSEEKTIITNIKQGFNFLGWNFKKYDNKLIIKPSNKNIDALTRKLSNIIKNNKTAKQENLIKQLNPVIIGWSNYNQKVCSRKVFEKLDYKLYKMLFSWALKRHRNKGKKWVINKYWKMDSKPKWSFEADEVKLKNFSNVPIVRQKWLDTSKNPYLDEDYFIQRSKLQRIDRLIKSERMAASKL